MQYEDKLDTFFSLNKVLGLIANHGKFWEQCAFLISIVLNIIVCMSYSVYFTDEINLNKGDSGYDKAFKNERLENPRLLFKRNVKNTKELITILGIINLAFSSLVVLFFLVKRAPLKVSHIWTNFS